MAKPDILPGSDPIFKAHAIRTLGALPPEAGAFVALRFQEPFEFLHEASQLRRAGKVAGKFLEYQELYSPKPKKGESPHPIVVDQSMEGILSGLRSSVEGKDLTSSRVSLVPTQRIVSLVSNDLADKIDLEDQVQIQAETVDPKRTDRLRFLEGRIAAFEWVLGRRETLEEEPTAQFSTAASE